MVPTDCSKTMLWYPLTVAMFSRALLVVVSCVKVTVLTNTGFASKQDQLYPCNAHEESLDTIQRIVQYNNWKHVYFLLEGSNVDVFKSCQEPDGIIMQVFHIEKDLKELLKGITDAQEHFLKFHGSFLNFIVVGTTRTINGLLKKLRVLSNENNARILLRHFSKWLMFPVDNEVIVPNGFDNIAVIGCVNKCYHLNQSSKVQTSADCTSMTVQTMLWNSGGQALSQPIPLESLANRSGSFVLYPNVHYGLNGQKLRLTITEWRPYAIKTLRDNVTSFEGVCPELIKILSALFNFTYEFTEPLDGQWGQLENGKWTGQIGDVNRGLADMTGSWLGMDYYRAKDVDFSYTLRISPYTILYVRTKDEHPLTYLVRQFRLEVYLYGLLTLLGITLLFFIAGLVLRKEGRNPVVNHYLETGMKLTFVFLSIALRQGISWTPGDITRRIILASFWLYTIIMTSVYCGNLIAFRSVRRSVGPYESLSEMISDEDITFGFEGESMLENILKLSEDKELKLLWQRISKTKETDLSVMDTNRSKHVERLYTGNYAFIVDAMTVPIITRGDCSVLVLDKSFLASPYSFDFPKHSPLPKLFNEKLTILLDSGYIDRMSESWYPKSECGAGEDRARPMVLMDYISVLVALGAAIVLSGGILVVECAIHRCKVHRI